MRLDRRVEGVNIYRTLGVQIRAGFYGRNLPQNLWRKAPKQLASFTKSGQVS